MESFHWDNRFVTGLPSVDEQHHHLVDVINRFGELVTLREAANGAEFEQIFNELTAYAAYHFRDEEQLMRKAGLDPRHMAAHVDEHVKFVEEVGRMHADVARDNFDSAQALLKFLTYWLAYHILGSDQVMARQIADIGRGMTAAAAFEADHQERDPATATLLHALNGLFQQVSERNRALFELNRTLEARVAERTRELREANQRLEDMAMTDVLTGLPNRRHAIRRFEREWQESSRSGTPLACLMIDADGFKHINDSYGHDAGDEVLRRLAQCLLDSVRTDDIVCRLGGDEFFVICPRTPLHGALQVGEKLRSEVAALRVPAGGGVWHGSISVGAAMRTPAMRGIEELMKAADDAVYVAKKEGRNRVAAAGA
jgi:diguanylate cyclase (GGDEF)-like protein/hemerythrin-like metal-binding protein